MTASHIGAAVIPERCDCRPGEMVGGRYYVEKVLDGFWRLWLKGVIPKGVTGPKGVAWKERNIVLLDSGVYTFGF